MGGVDLTSSHSLRRLWRRKSDRKESELDWIVSSEVVVLMVELLFLVVVIVVIVVVAGLVRVVVGGSGFGEIHDLVDLPRNE
eukprot:1320942-Heterocapsa_arctica.AAC.1